MKRLFLALDLPPETRQSLADAVSWMRAFEDRVKVVPAENYHVTLKFLGPTAEERIGPLLAALEREARAMVPLDLRLEGWGVFPEKGHPNVFWAGVTPVDAALPLFEECESALEPLGFARDTRGFHPHVTLARTGTQNAPAEFLKKWKALGLLKGPAEIRAESITLYESLSGPRGPVYRVVGVWGWRGEGGRGPVSRIKKFNLLRGIQSAGFF